LVPAQETTNTTIATVALDNAAEGLRRVFHQLGEDQLAEIHTRGSIASKRENRACRRSNWRHPRNDSFQDRIDALQRMNQS